MNKIMIPILLAIVVISGIGGAYAIPFLDNIGKVNQPFPFKVTMLVIDYEQMAGGSDSDGSYLLVYGKDIKSGKDRIIEIQTNMGSSIGNLMNAKEINRDYNWFKTKANVGKTITYECNGFDNIDAFEEYPQCFKIIEIKKPQ